MFASFHSRGTIPSYASGILINFVPQFFALGILGAFPSTPGDLVSVILFILLSTTSGVTTNPLIS